MYNAGRHTAQSAQGIRVVQVAQQWLDAPGPQFTQAPGTRRQCQQPYLARHPSRNTHTDIATPDYQNAFAPKPRRQGAKWVLV